MPNPSSSPRIAVEPHSGRYDALVAAVRQGGGTVTDIDQAEGLVWADAARADLLPPFLAAQPTLRWVQLPFAGIENFTHLLDHDRIWTCGKGVYARPVAEHALALALALALTPETTGLIAAEQLAQMRPHAWLINVARGGHVVTADLVEALAAGTIGGAALDVTDPEPLPPGHPLWSLPNCLISPHVGNTPEMGEPLLAQRVKENVARWAQGQPLLGLVDVAAGY